MEGYVYTFDVLKWDNKIEQYIDKTANEYGLIYSIEKNFFKKKEVVLTFKGSKESLEKFERKFFRGLSKVVKIHNFIKHTITYSLQMLQSDDFFDINSCDFKMYTSSMVFNLNNYQDKMIKLIKSGKIGLIKNLNGYYLISIITKTKTISQLRKVTHKTTQTLPILLRSVNQADKFTNITTKEKELLLSSIKPIVKVKKRYIHRLEKVKNRPVNAISFTNFYDIKLPKNKIEESLANLINQPLVFLQVDIDKIDKDEVDFILTTPKSFLFYEDSYIQFIYGRKNIIKNGYGISPIKIRMEKSLKEPIYANYKSNIALRYKNELLLAPYGMQKEIFFHIFGIKNIKKVEIDTTFALANIHRYLSHFDEAIIFDFNNFLSRVILYDSKDYQELYKFEISIKKIFDTLAIKDKKVEKINYENEALLLSDSFYEICHQEIFKYSIKERLIKIEIDLDISNLTSALINTLSQIVIDISKDMKKRVILCGNIFEIKNLTENIIEAFEDNNIDFYLSEEIPLNEISTPLGVLI